VTIGDRRAHGSKIRPLARLLQWYASSLLLLLVSNTALAQQPLIVADDGTNALAFRNKSGKVATFICPSRLTLKGEVWGTDVYMDESRICSAAVHAGALIRGTSGQVTIVMGGDAQSLQGTQRNGIESWSYGPWSSTYSFIKNGEDAQIDWYTTYDRVPDDFNSPLTVVCPPKGNTDSYVWGTDVYSASSAICLSAVHAGAITLDAGGRVTLTLQPKQDLFVASLRNGISTRAWTDWNFQAYPQPYKVTPGMTTVTAPTSAPAREVGPRQATSSGSTSSGPRTIPLIGFRASGTAVPIVPRTITLGGFSASGATTSVTPRTITLNGFSATGTATPIVPRSISLSGFTATGTATAIVPRTLPVAGWTAVGAPTTP